MIYIYKDDQNGRWTLIHATPEVGEAQEWLDENAEDGAAYILSPEKTL